MAYKGAVLVLVKCEGKCILARQPGKKRQQNQFTIYWKLLGGKVEQGERPEEAAIREVLEESGINLQGQKLVLLSTTPQTGRFGDYFQYLFEVNVPPPLIAAHDGKVVIRYDDENELVESTCFDLGELEGMYDFMPKHREMLLCSKQAA